MGSIPTPEEDDRHTLVREVDHAEAQYEKVKHMAEVQLKNGDLKAARENERQARNAKRFIEDRRAKLKSRYGVTDPKAEAYRLVVDKGLSFRDKGDVIATNYDG